MKLKSTFFSCFALLCVLLLFASKPASADPHTKFMRAEDQIMTNGASLTITNVSYDAWAIFQLQSYWKVTCGSTTTVSYLSGTNILNNIAYTNTSSFLKVIIPDELIYIAPGDAVKISNNMGSGNTNYIRILWQSTWWPM